MLVVTDPIDLDAPISFDFVSSAISDANATTTRDLPQKCSVVPVFEKIEKSIVR
jgi:hypothetical protein